MLEMHIKIPSVEDAPDESPSIRVGIEDDMIGIETIYGSTSLPLADFDRVVDAVRDYRQGTGRGADPTGSGVGRMAKQFIVTVECSVGNESIGEMWTETAVFSPASTLADVEEWLTAGPGSKYRRHLGGRGRVTLTYDARSLPPIEEPF